MSQPTRYFEYIGGSSCKFWQVSVEGNQVIVQYGRIGAAGQSSTRTLSDAAAANRHAEQQIAAKLKKGYRAAEPR